MQKKEPIFEYLESICEFVPVCFWWMGLDKIVLGCNKATLNSIGASKPEDFVGKNALAHYKDEEVAKQLEEWADEAIRTEVSLQREHKIIDISSRKPKYYSGTYAPLYNARGEIIGLVGTSVDITAEKETEQLRLEAVANKATLAEKEADALRFQNEALQAATKEQEKFKKAVEQMMHDITSPITSINTIISRLGSNVAENDRVTLRHASERIESISQRLLNKYNNNDTNERAENLLVSLALLQILNEKREEYLETNIQFETDIDENAKFCFIKHNLGIFKRMISNLINNALYALKDTREAKIKLTLAANNGSVILIIHDNGPGMPQHIIDKFKQGIQVTEGKESGHGIGLAQVSGAVKFGNGECKINASEKYGTQITIYFPEIEMPQWIATEIKLTRDDTVLILDDDESIHGAWDNKFDIILAKVPTLQIKHFSQGQDVISYINNLTDAQKENTYLLTDYELLEQGMNGLDVVEQIKMHRATLVTSYATQNKIQNRVTELGIRMLPKELVSAVKIKVDKKLVKASKIVDMVWVEDQKWFVNNLVEKHYSHLKVDVYYDPISFMEDVIQYPLDTRIILDIYYDAPDGTPYLQTGYTLAKELHAMGYSKLILFSGEKLKGSPPEYLQIVHKNDIDGSENLDKI